MPRLTNMEINTDDIRLHYRYLDHREQTEVRIFGANLGKRQYSYFAATEDEFVDIVARLTRNNFNVGVGVHERCPGGTHNTDVICLKRLSIDLDKTDPETVKFVEDTLNNNGYPIAAKVASGNKGWHFYINVEPIKEPALIRDFLLNAQHHLIHTLKLPIDDSCFDPARIMRVWGSIHPISQKPVAIHQLFTDDEIAKSITYDSFPQRPATNRTYISDAKDKSSDRESVVPFSSFITDFLNGRLSPPLPLKQNTAFMQVFVPNVVAYAKAKRLPLTELYSFAQRKGRLQNDVDSWALNNASYVYGQFRANIREHYPEHYQSYFARDTRAKTASVRYAEPGATVPARDEYREAEWFTVSDDWKVKVRVISPDSAQVQTLLAYAYDKEDAPSGDDEFEITSQTALQKRRRSKYFTFFNEPKLTPKEAKELGLIPPGKPIEASMYYSVAIDDSGQEYTVLSEAKLESGEYVLYGNRYDIKDKAKVGVVAKIETARRMLVVHSYEQIGTPIRNFNEMYERMPLTPSELLTWLLTDTSQSPSPIYDPGVHLQKMYLAWLLSGDDKGKQLNLIVMGAPGSGKTPQLEAISQKFDEPLSSGAAVTIKGLTVSFYGDTPKLGGLLKSKRVFAVDELFKILNNRNLSSYEDLSSLNTVLDGAFFQADSGKHTMRLRSTCRMLAATNPIHERFTHSRTIGQRMTFARLCEVLPSDFVGRLCFFLQTKDEHKEVLSGKRIKYSHSVPSLSRGDFLAWYDFVNAQPIIGFDEQRLRDITNRIKMPDVFSAVYRKEQSRSAKLIFNGLVRLRVLEEKGKEFRATHADYVDFEALWKELHMRWFEDVPPQDPLMFCNDEEIEIYRTLQREAINHGETRLSDYRAMKVGLTPELRARLQRFGLIDYDRETRKFELSAPAEVLPESEDDVSLDD